MSKIYAVIGTNLMTIVADTVKYNPQTNEVLMQSERPSEGDWVANEDGQWVEDKQKAIDALDAQYNADKADLLTAYQTAMFYGDTDTMESLKADLSALDNQYDEDYERIVGEG
jgi:predicted oxidoreductase (fatty acid repression mutant protein)